MTQRLLYPDICKFFAIFLVTCSHCAQQISGVTWTNFFLGTHLDIAFNMPLFMLISGWFINLDKMRAQKPYLFFWAKFKRLMIPAFVWWLVLFIIRKPHSSPLSFYWYLTALFICMGIIYCFAKVFKNDIVCMIVSTLFVMACPQAEFVNVNFMFPYLWCGLLLKKLYDSKYDKGVFCASLTLGIILSLFWKTDYTIYMCPFRITIINVKMIAVYVYRFLIGLSLSSTVIYIIKKYQNHFPSFAKYGQYSLAVYTGSVVFNAVVAKILNHVGYHTNQMFLIDVYSIVICVIIYALIVVFGSVCRRNKVSRLLFLGE